MKNNVVVSLHARFTFPDGAKPRLTTVEEMMDVIGLLNAATLDDAVAYFLAHTNAATAAEDVRSLKIGGHEILRTFIDVDPTRHPSIKRKRDADGMTRLLRKSLDVLAEAQAQREHGQVIGDDVMKMLESTVQRFRATLDDWGHRN